MPQRYDDHAAYVSESVEVVDEVAEVSYSGDSTYGPSVVIAALDQIQILVEEARSVPLSANIMLNKAEILDLVSQAREALPDDLVTADAVVADADAVLNRADNVAEAAVTEAAVKSRTLLDDAREKADTVLAEASDEAQRRVERAKEEAEETTARAQAEAEALVANASAQADHLVAAENISALADKRARELVAQAKAQAVELRGGADRYVSSSLEQTADLLQELLRRTEAGLRAVSGRAEGNETTNINLD